MFINILDVFDFFDCVLNEKYNDILSEEKLKKLELVWSQEIKN